MVVQTKTVTTDGTGALIFELDVQKLESLMITPDVAGYIGFGDLGQAAFPILANQAYIIIWSDFSEKARRKSRIIRIYGKRQVAGTINFVLNYIGGN